jgi:hypothetical protein
VNTSGLLRRPPCWRALPLDVAKCDIKWKAPDSSIETQSLWKTIGIAPDLLVLTPVFGLVVGAVLEN